MVPVPYRTSRRCDATLRTRERLVLPVAAVLLVALGCNDHRTPSEIDRRSYNLGGIGAFAEMVGAGVKQLALSAPLSPSEMDALVEEATRIAAENGANVYRETDFMVTALFPAELTDGKHVLLIYKDETLQEYWDLKAERARLIEADGYVGEARLDIARRFGALLSYSDERIDELLGEVP